MLSIRKSVGVNAFKTDEEVFNFQYNVQDYLLAGYEFCYGDQEPSEQLHEKPISNPLLTQGDVRDYFLYAVRILGERLKQLSAILGQGGIPPKQSAAAQQAKDGKLQGNHNEKSIGESADMGEIEKWTSKMKPQGTERYFKIDRYLGHQYRSEMRDREWTAGRKKTYGVSFHRTGSVFVMKPGDTRYESVQTNVAVYGDKMYVVKDGYLCVTAMGKMQNQGRVLGRADISAEKMTPLVANDYGIFAVDAGGALVENSEAQILWYTHEGSINKRIIIKGDVQETYICGKLLFYLKPENEWKNGYEFVCSAYWMDMETEEEHCIFHAAFEGSESEDFCRWAFVNYIFGNERGAVFLIDYHHANKTEEGRFSLEQCGWYYYDFSKPEKLFCLSNSKNGSHNIYNKPEDYLHWIEKCLEKYDYDPYYINIMAFDMEKNLMWVSQKPNGDGPWEPMNITGDLQKRRRPDLPVWDLSERIEVLKQSKKIYFDGKRCYTYIDKKFLADYFHSNSDGYGAYFCSIDAKGEIEKWPVPSQGPNCDFMVLGDCVRIIQKPENSDENYGTQAIPFHYFPASHEFQKVLCKDKNDYPYCVYDIRWMIKEYEEKQKAADKCQEQEQQADWGDILAESGNQDDWGDILAKLGDRTWQVLRLKPSYMQIECSFSVRKNSIRTAFIVKGHAEVFAQAERARDAIERELQGYDISWDSESNAEHINLTTSKEGMSTSEQYDWFCRAAEALYNAVRPRLNV